MLKGTQKSRRQARIRKQIRGTKDMPRLSVFRSNAYIYGQLIDDSIGETLVGLGEKHVKDVEGTKVQKAKAIGIALAKLATEKKIKKVVFDRGNYKYHGRVKELAEGAREGGLVF